MGSAEICFCFLVTPQTLRILSLQENAESMYINWFNRITTFMTLRMFEQIKRFFHISEPVRSLPRCQWYHKLLPLADELQQRFQQYLRPASAVAIDEMMIRFVGRSFHTIAIPGKPIPLGYKVLALAERGYTFGYIFTSRVESFAGQNAISEYQNPIKLSPTSLAVLKLCLQLPYEENHFTLYCDNYFSNIPLFQVLRTFGISACGTARINSAEFPKVLKVDKKKVTLPWDTLSAVQVREVLAVLWQDNNLVRLLTTAHSCQKHDRKDRYRRRPRETTSNRAAVQGVWGPQAHRNLSVPALTADYNDNMGGVDIADQCRTYYATQLRVARNWMPLFFWLLDTTVINAYIIAHELYPTHQAYKKDLRWKWHEDLAWELVKEGYYELNPEHARYRETNPHASPNGSSCPGSIPTGNSHESRRKGYVSKYYELSVCRKQPVKHALQHAGKERLCVFCRYLRTPSPLLSPELRNTLISHPQAPRHNKTRQSSYQCSYCQLFLCKEFCFSHFHDL